MSDRIELRGLAPSACTAPCPRSRCGRSRSRSTSTSSSTSRPAGRSDDLARHRRLRRVGGPRRSTVVSRERHALLERLAERIAEELTADDRIESVTVAVRKLRPPVPEQLDVGRCAHHPAPTVTRAFLGLGSNLGDRWQYLRDAVAALPDVVGVSGVYETEPVGGPGRTRAVPQLVVELRTELSPRELLDVRHRLEAAAGRVRGERWGPRTLDVDMLLVDGRDRRRARPRRPPPPHVGAALRARPAGRPRPRTAARGAGRRDCRRGRGSWVACRGRPAPARGWIGERRLRVPARSRVIGAGRAGGSLARALRRRAGWEVAGRPGPRATTSRPAAADGVDLLVLATPDAAVAEVAAAVEPVSHDGRRPPGRARSASTCSRPIGAGPRSTRCWPSPDAEPAPTLATAPGSRSRGDPLAREVVADLGGRPVEVADADRAAYHAAACIASNHLVALLGQVERVARRARRAVRGLPRPRAGHGRQRRRARPGRRAHRARRPRRLGHRRAPPRPLSTRPSARRTRRWPPRSLSRRARSARSAA